jgi:phosphate transport system substrate-binding protein
MSQKKTETLTLVLLLLVAAGLIGVGFWWANDWSGFEFEFVSNLSIGSRDGAKKKLQQPDDNAQTSAEVPGTPPGLLNYAAGDKQQTANTRAQTFAEVLNVPSGLFNYGGSTTWAPIRKTVDPTIQSVWSQFRLRYTSPVIDKPGSGTGIKMLLDNQLAFSQSSRPVEEKEYQEALQRGFTLKEIPVAIDGIAIAVHPDLNIPGLSVAQLKDIYTGKINNWKQVGGPNIPLTPYSRPKEAGGTVEFFVDNVLKGEKLGTNVKIVSDTTNGLRKVILDPGGIYYASATEVVPQCDIKPLPIGSQPDQLVPPYEEPLVKPSQCPNQRNRLNRVAIQSGEYPITRRLFVIVKQNDLEDEQAGRAYAALLLSHQGQELINDAGFISLH